MKRPADLRVDKNALLLVAMLAITLTNSSLAVSQQPAKCAPLLSPPQIGPTVARVENRTKGSVFRRGDRISVTLILRAGSQGIYLPDFFGAFMQTCRHGFAATLLTGNGRPADPTPTGCGSAGPTPRTTYVELNAGETRTWSMQIPTSSIPPGHYCLYAEYLNSEISMNPSSDFPQDKAGSVVVGHIPAPAIPIEIR